MADDARTIRCIGHVLIDYFIVCCLYRPMMLLVNDRDREHLASEVSVFRFGLLARRFLTRIDIANARSTIRRRANNN